MTVKRKLHSAPCSQADNIAKINDLLVGNHKPENGVVYKVMRTSDDINTIKDQIVNLNENHNVLLTEITGVGKKVANIEGIQAGREIKDDWNNNAWMKWLTIAGVVSAIGLGIWSNLKDDTKITAKDFQEIKTSLEDLKKKYSLLIDE